jgi:hypothetical protein
MAIENLIHPNNFVHRRQELLWKKLQEQEGVLPEGADTLIKEAIEEYQLAFGSKLFNPDFSHEIETFFSMDLPGVEDRALFRGNSYLLNIKFGEESKNIKYMEKVHAIVPVRLKFANLPDINVYPTFERLIPVNEQGQSKKTSFLIDIPRNAQTGPGRIFAEAFNGGVCVEKLSTAVNVF